MHLEAFLTCGSDNYYTWSCLGYKTLRQTSEDTALVDKRELKVVGVTVKIKFLQIQFRLGHSEVASSIKAMTVTFNLSISYHKRSSVHFCEVENTDPASHYEKCCTFSSQNYLSTDLKLKIINTRVPVVAQWKQIQLGTMGLRVRSLALLSGLGIRRCRELLVWVTDAAWIWCGCGCGQHLQLQ